MAKKVQSWRPPESILADRETFLEACKSEALAKQVVNACVSSLRERIVELSRFYGEWQKDDQMQDIPLPERTYEAKRRPANLAGLKTDLFEGKRQLSLDVFDTCLVRTLENPLTVFEWVGLRLKEKTGIEPALFSVERHAVENFLREKILESGLAEDVCFAEIYSSLAEKFGWTEALRDEAMAYEVECEHLVLQGVEEVRQFADEARKAGLELVYTSEMYLPSAIVRKFLESAGYPVEETTILTSGETGRSKGTGSLYRLAIDSHAAGDVLHVGDNLSTDVDVPSRMGLDCVPVVAPRKAHSGLLGGVLAGLIESFPGSGNYWEALGFKVAGPLHFAFCREIYRHCQKQGVKQVGFLSRDGWFPKKVFDRLQVTWGAVADTDYVYASREMLGIAGMETIEAEDWEFILKPAPLLRVKDFFERLSIPADCYEPRLKNSLLPGAESRICHYWGFENSHHKDELYRIICDCIEPFLDYRDVVMSSTREYLSEKGLGSRDSLFVDVGWSGSSSWAMQRLFGTNDVAKGYYFALLDAAAIDAGTFFKLSSGSGGIRDLIVSGIALLEFMFGSPEPSVSRVCQGSSGWEPVFRKEWSASEKAAWNSLERGIARFVEEAVRLLPHDPGGDGKAFVEEVLYPLICEPTPEDLVHLGMLSHAEGWGCDRRLRLLPVIEGNEAPLWHEQAFLYAPWKHGLRRLINGY